MNKFKVELHATDCYGLKFLEQVIWLSSMGATLDKEYPNKNTWPNKAMFYVQTEEFLEDDMANGVRVYPVELQYSKERLEEFEWDKLKSVCKERGISGRDRSQLIRQYEESFVKKEEV